LPGGGGLTAPILDLTAPLWTAGFRVVSAVVGACVLRLLVVFVPRTSSTPMATWFWQTEGRSVECVILGVRLSDFILLEFQSPSRRIFIGSHSLPPLSGRLIGPSILLVYKCDLALPISVMSEYVCDVSLLWWLPNHGWYRDAAPDGCQILASSRMTPATGWVTVGVAYISVTGVN
jgi:hypothetical protein